MNWEMITYIKFIFNVWRSETTFWIWFSVASMSSLALKHTFFQPKHVWKSLDQHYCRGSCSFLSLFYTWLVVLQNSTHSLLCTATTPEILFTILLHSYIYFVCVWGAHMCHACVLRSILSYHVGPRDGTQAIRLDGNAFAHWITQQLLYGDFWLNEHSSLLSVIAIIPMIKVN